MRRRSFAGLLVAGAVALATGANAGPPVARVAFVAAANVAVAGIWVAALKAELRHLGYEDGRNIIFDTRFAEFDVEEMDRMTAEVIASKPTVIVAQGRTISRLAKLTKSTPILAANSSDMIEAGLVKSLARPGGNVTGVQLLYFDLVGKRLEVLKEILPKIERIAVLASPLHPGVDRERIETEAAAKRLGLSTSYYPVKQGAEIDGGLEAIRASGAQAIVSFPDGLTFPLRVRIADFARTHRIATVAGWDSYADAGHLVVYGPNLTATYAQLARQADKILRGASPATVPVEFPTSFELVVNLRTARALGLVVPQSVLLRADRVIE
jgi:putative ABC transport system substrate-binding protein